MGAHTKKSSEKSKQKPLVEKDHLFKKRTWLMIGLTLIIIGMIFGGNDLVTNWLEGSNTTTRAEAIANNQPVYTPEKKISGTPLHITIPSVQIDLDILPGEYDSNNKSWTLSLNSAQWAVMTAEPNNKNGLTFIYAHNRPNVFMTLPKIKKDAEVIIKTKNGHTFIYKLVDRIITKPDDTSLFSYKGIPILVLQTCTGVWYQNRTLFHFELVSAQ